MWVKPELCRVYALLAERHADGHGFDPEHWLNISLAQARQQHDRYAELCAARDLGRLYVRRGEREKAHDLLAEICRGFIGGSDSPDLLQARTLLATLA